MKDKLIEKADELKEQFVERNKNVRLPHPIMLGSMADGYRMGIIDGATWQREQLEAEIKEAREIIKYTLGIIDGYNKNDSESGFGGHTYNCTNCPVDKCYENKQCWFDVIKGRGQQFIAKLDLLEKENK